MPRAAIALLVAGTLLATAGLALFFLTDGHDINAPEQKSGTPGFGESGATVAGALPDGGESPPGSGPALDPLRAIADGTGSSPGGASTAMPDSASSTNGGSAAAPPQDGAPSPTEVAVGMPTDADAGRGTLRVFVRFEGGPPIAGAVVALRSGSSSQSLTTDAAGLATADDTAAGAYDVAVTLPPPDALLLQNLQPVALAAGQRRDVEIAVPLKDGEITGRTLDAEGSGLAGILVEATPSALPAGDVRFHLRSTSPARTTSAADGSFVLTGLFRLEHSVTASRPDGTVAARASATAGSGAPVELVLREQRTVAVEGLVRSSNGEPLAQATVSATTHAGTAAATGPDGRYRLEIRYERGRLGLSAKRPGSRHAAASIEETDVQAQIDVGLSVDFELDGVGEVGVLHGTVVSKSDRRAIARQQVHLHSPSSATTASARTSDDGSFTIEELEPAGDYRLWITPESGYRDLVLPAVAVAIGENRIDLELEPLETARLSGRVVRPDGRVVARLTLWARSVLAGSNAVAIRTDAAGRFGPLEVSAGNLSIETRASPWITVTGIALEPADERDVEIVVGSGDARIAGRIVDSDGHAVAGAQVALSWSRVDGGQKSQLRRETISDAGGRFELTLLPSGKCQLSVRAQGFRDTQHETSGDESGELAITLRR